MPVGRTLCSTEIYVSIIIIAFNFWALVENNEVHEIRKNWKI
jgi:hypothetical protein